MLLTMFKWPIELLLAALLLTNDLNVIMLHLSLQKASTEHPPLNRNTVFFLIFNTSNHPPKYLKLLQEPKPKVKESIIVIRWKANFVCIANTV